jgi:hypothetical protein
MDSIFIFEIDRIYRIIWMFAFPDSSGTREKNPVHPVDPVDKKFLKSIHSLLSKMPCLKLRR